MSTASGLRVVAGAAPRLEDIAGTDLGSGDERTVSGDEITALGNEAAGVSAVASGHEVDANGEAGA